MSKKFTSQTDDGGCLYVDATHRRCVAEISESCVNLSDMRCGHISAFTAPANMIYDRCIKCRAYENKMYVKKAKETTATGIIKIMETMIKRPVAGSEGPSLIDFANQFIHHMGGIEETANKTAAVTNEILTSEDCRPKEKLEAVGRITSILSLLHKTKQEPIDISSLDIENLTEDLKKYAKELVLTSKEFREELLADPDVRKIMLLDTGVTVVDEFELEYSP